MNRTIRPWLSVALIGMASMSVAAERLPAGVACLLEDNAAELLPLLTNPGGDLGEGEVESKVVFSGTSAIKITRYQRYFNLLPGWAYRIAENPKDGEYRYLRLAWKSDGLTGIMLQLHDDKDWTIRYTAGANKHGWATKTIADSPPSEWAVVTVDLFKDFGSRELHGIALTAFDGTAGYFDHIYLARSVEELDDINATSWGAEALVLSAEDVETLYQQLHGADAAVAYEAYWKLVAAGPAIEPILNGKLPPEPVVPRADDIAGWIADLDSEQYEARERATERLKANLAAAHEFIQQALARPASLEAQARLEDIRAGARSTVDQASAVDERLRRLVRTIAVRADNSRP